jgi:alkylation response protein AidB-like acyl-CoA dehydrogenase
MGRGGGSRDRDVDLRVGAVMAEIEGLYTMLLRTGRPEHRRRILADLAYAGRRLTALTNSPQAQGRSVTSLPPSRLRRRRDAALRGAEWIGTRFGDTNDPVGS